MFGRFSSLLSLRAVMAALSFQHLPQISMLPMLQHQGRTGRKRRRTGHRYPHSSARQQARYARQIAAGRLSMEGAGR